MSNEFVQILLGAAINETSIKSINNQIKKIQDDLKDIDINFNVNTSKGSNQVFSQMENQIKDLQKQIVDLENALSSVGKGKSVGEGAFNGFNKNILKATNSLKELEDYLGKNGFAYKVDFDTKDGEKKIKQIVADIRHASGEIEKIKIVPDNNNGFKQVEESINNLNFRDFYKNQEKAIQMIEEAGRVGRVSAKELEDYKRMIQGAGTNNELERMVDNFKLLNKESSHENKWGNAQENLRNQANQSIQVLEKMRDTMGRLGGDTSQFDSLINNMREFSNINISKDTDIQKANSGFANLNKQVSELKNNTSSYETVMKSLENSLLNAQHKGHLTGEALSNIRMDIINLNQSDINLDDKLQRVRLIADDVHNKITAIKRDKEIELNTQRARNELEKLNASLTKTINSYKRTVDMDEANSIRSALGSMSNTKAFGDLGEVQKYRSELEAINTRIKKLNADATVGARNSMGVIDSFKVAMER